MLDKILSNPAFFQVSVVLVVLVLIAIWRRLKRAITILLAVYGLYLLFLVIRPAAQPEDAALSEESLQPATRLVQDTPAAPPPREEVSAEIPPFEEALKETLPVKDLTEETSPPVVEAVETGEETFVSPPKVAEEGRAPGLEVNRMVICREVQNRVPLGIDSLFSSDVVRVYCFTALRNLQGEQRVRHIWTYQGQRRGLVEMVIGRSHNWRAWSIATIPPRLTGNWEVAVVDSSDALLQAVTFTIRPTDSR